MRPVVAVVWLSVILFVPISSAEHLPDAQEYRFEAPNDIQVKATRPVPSEDTLEVRDAADGDSDGIVSQHEVETFEDEFRHFLQNDDRDPRTFVNGEPSTASQILDLEFDHLEGPVSSTETLDVRTSGKHLFKPVDSGSPVELLRMTNEHDVQTRVTVIAPAGYEVVSHRGLSEADLSGSQISGRTSTDNMVVRMEWTDNSDGVGGFAGEVPTPQFVVLLLLMAIVGRAARAGAMRS